VDEVRESDAGSVDGESPSKDAGSSRFEPPKEIARVPVVGVGASAGGLEAFTELLTHLPGDTGLALVLIQHLEPTHASDLAEILGRKASMPVVEAESGMRIEGDHVYVIAPNTELRVIGDAFSLSPRPSGRTPSLTVDIFLTSLAEQYGSQSIGVVLSGTGSDGTNGLASIKDADGITLVQDPDTARQRGMPASAVAAGVADAVLPIDGIARELVRLARHPYVRSVGQRQRDAFAPLEEQDERALQAITARVVQVRGLDLGHYKRATLLRRIERRMAAKRVDSMSEYVAILERDDKETAELLADVLVRVTSFFRNPEVFEALKSRVFPTMLDGKASDDAVRIWVPGCATGQEPYSIVMVLLEHFQAAGVDARIQVFASDLRETDLAIARRGVFPQGIFDEVGEERIRRFFTEVEDGYQVNKVLRDACIFAHHDVTRDPPFGRLDLLSCRNLLIYLDNVLQERLLRIFHYALVPDGTLVLGESEGVSSGPGLFARTEDKAIFRRLPGASPSFAFSEAHPSIARLAHGEPTSQSFKDARDREWIAAQQQLDDMLLHRYAPAAVLINDDLQIKQIRGNAGEYLRFRAGEASLDLASMVSPGFASAVTSAVSEVRDTQSVARREAVHPRAEGGHAAVDIVVIPIASPDARMHYAVLFNEGATVSRSPEELGAEPTEMEYLRQELDASTERLRILRTGRDEANESLRAAYEEIQSTNEELQSMNEELETAKEELQSTNEELTTLNDELQNRNVELARRNDDLDNLLSSASIAMLVLDANLTIRRYTAKAAGVFNLIPGDIGRRVTDIRWRIKVKDVAALLSSVIESGQVDEREVVDDSGSWFRMTTRPYRTSEGEIRGAVVTLVDTDMLRKPRAGE